MKSGQLNVSTFLNDLRPDTALDYTEMRSRDFADGPGEMDMLIGFFLMNGACIVFFLMFGMCVICSCMRRKPNFNSSEKPEKEAKRPKKEKEHSPAPPKPTFAAPPPITSPSLKPTFKAIVARAMENQRLMKQQVTAGTKSEATVESGEACAPVLTANDTGKNNRRSATSDAAHGDDAQRTTLLRPKEDGDAVKEPLPNNNHANHVTKDKESGRDSVFITVDPPAEEVVIFL